MKTAYLYVANRTQLVGDRVSVNTSIYVCTAEGENAGTLTGTETGTNIQDGTVEWSSLGPSVVQIPLRNDLPFWDMQVDLETSTYTLQFRWNVRSNSWTFTVLDEQDLNVLTGDSRVVVNFPMGYYNTNRAPVGLFLFLDTSNQGLDPGLTDLGGRVQIVYLTAAWLGL